MDSDEKMNDLKKIYANVLLHTTEEAATRIIVSEKKVVRLEHELKASKEQAVQMLMGLKSMMDFQVSEAQTNSLSQQIKIEELEAQVCEARTHSLSQQKMIEELKAQVAEAQRKSISQQKKIDELEAQLEEGEDIVKEVREELSVVHDKLVRVRNNQLKERKAEIKSSATCFTEKSALDHIKEVYNSQDAIDGTGSDGMVEPNTTFISKDRLNAVKFPGQVSKGHIENSYGGMRVSHINELSLPSIIRGSKRGNAYPSRFQRIRAFEEELRARELSFSATTNKDMNEGKGIDGANDEICKQKGSRAIRTKGVTQAVSKVRSFRRKRGRMSGSDRTSDGETNSDNNDADEDRVLSSKQCTLVKCKMGNEGDVSETVGLQRVCADVGEIDVSVVSAKEVVSGTYCDLLKKSVNDGLKHTFQRRKKQCLSNSNSNTSVLNKILKEEEFEKQKDRMETVECTSMAESPQDSWDDELLARQLLGLSKTIGEVNHNCPSGTGILG